MKEDYIISINGIQNICGEKEKLDLKTIGAYINNGNKKYIVYREFNENMPKDKIMTVLTVDKNIITLKRLGTSSNSFVLEKGKRHNCLYYTYMGLVKLGVFTYNIKDLLSEHGGTLYAQYNINFDSEFSSNNELSVKVEPKEKTNLKGENDV